MWQYTTVNQCPSDTCPSDGTALEGRGRPGRSLPSGEVHVRPDSEEDDDMTFKKIKKRWWIAGGIIVVVAVLAIVKLSGSNGDGTIVQADLAYVDDILEIVSASGRIQPQTKEIGRAHV